MCQPGRPLSLAGVISETHTVFFDFYSREQNMIIISDLRGFMGSVIKTLPFVRRSLFNDSRMRCELQVDESAQLTLGVIIKTQGGDRTKSGRRRRSVQNSRWRHRFHTEDGKKAGALFCDQVDFPKLLLF